MVGDGYHKPEAEYQEHGCFHADAASDTRRPEAAVLAGANRPFEL